MFRVAVLIACLALCHSHVLPLVVPAAHAHRAPLVVPYPLHHGYYGTSFLGQGLVAKPLVHHILKRSPHYAPFLHAPLAVAPVAHIAPVAVSHQSRLDVHTSPGVVAAPILPLIKPLVAPILPVTPILHKSLVSPLHYGAGHYGGLYPHYGYY